MERTCHVHLTVASLGRHNEPTELFVIIMMKIIWYGIVSQETHAHPFPYTLSRHWTGGRRVQTNGGIRNDDRSNAESLTRIQANLIKKNERIQSIAFKLFASPVPCVTLGPKNLPFWEAPCFDHVLVLPFSIPRGGPVRSRRGTTSPGGV